jgi:hypothetical protein
MPIANLAERMLASSLRGTIPAQIKAEEMRRRPSLAGQIGTQLLTKNISKMWAEKATGEYDLDAERIAYYNKIKDDFPNVETFMTEYTNARNSLGTAKTLEERRNLRRTMRNVKRKINEILPGKSMLREQSLLEAERKMKMKEKKEPKFDWKRYEAMSKVEKEQHRRTELFIDKSMGDLYKAKGMETLVVESAQSYARALNNDFPTKASPIVSELDSLVSSPKKINKSFKTFNEGIQNKWDTNMKMIDEMKVKGLNKNQLKVYKALILMEELIKIEPYMYTEKEDSDQKFFHAARQENEKLLGKGYFRNEKLKKYDGYMTDIIKKKLTDDEVKDFGNEVENDVQKSLGDAESKFGFNFPYLVSTLNAHEVKSRTRKLLFGTKFGTLALGLTKDKFVAAMEGKDPNLFQWLKLNAILLKGMPAHYTDEQVKEFLETEYNWRKYKPSVYKHPITGREYIVEPKTLTEKVFKKFIPKVK